MLKAKFITTIQNKICCHGNYCMSAPVKYEGDGTKISDFPVDLHFLLLQLETRMKTIHILPFFFKIPQTPPDGQL